MFGVQFYPTPKPVVEMMMDKVDWSGVHFVLEPSAGKGDIVDGVAQRMKGMFTITMAGKQTTAAKLSRK